jgi:hypothetical protein
MTFSLGGGNDIFDTNAAYTVDDIVMAATAMTPCGQGQAMIRFTAAPAMTT